MTVRRAGLAVTGLVLAASGAYVLVYLYRWEWNRALIAGVFFVAAELALGLQVLLHRIRLLEARLDARPPTGDGSAPGPPAPLDRLRETAPEPHPHFAWLDPSKPDGGTMNVFIPVLLGTGVLLSVAAALVEKAGSVTARPVLEHRLAGRLAPLTPPPGDLFEPVPPAPVGAEASTGPGPRLAGRIAAGALAVVVVTGVIVAMAGGTKDAIDVVEPGSASEVVLTVEHRFTERTAERTVEALWISCRDTIGTDSSIGDVERRSGGNLSFVVRPGLGEHAAKRFEGCMEDALFDRVSAAVSSISKHDA